MKTQFLTKSFACFRQQSRRDPEFIVRRSPTARLRHSFILHIKKGHHFQPSSASTCMPSWGSCDLKPWFTYDDLLALVRLCHLTWEDKTIAACKVVLVVGKWNLVISLTANKPLMCTRFLNCWREVVGQNKNSERLKCHCMFVYFFFFLKGTQAKIKKKKYRRWLLMWFVMTYIERSFSRSWPATWQQFSDSGVDKQPRAS